MGSVLGNDNSSSEITRATQATLAPIPAAVRTRRTAKSVNATRRKSFVACDQFMRDDKGLRLARLELAKGGSLVSIPAPSSPSPVSSPSPSPSPAPSLSLAPSTSTSSTPSHVPPHLSYLLIPSTPTPPSAGAKRIPSSYGATPVTLLQTSPKAHTASLEPLSIAGTPKLCPVAFARVRDAVRARYSYLALVSLGPVLAVHINLGTETLSRATREPRFLDWLSRRIKRDLYNAFGRDVNLYLCLEELCVDHIGRESTRPHLHGFLALSPEEAPKARAVLRRTVGEWQEHRQFQVRTGTDHDFDGATYAAKRTFLASPRFRGWMRRMGSPRRYTLTFSGAAFTATKPVMDRAAILYRQAVEDVLLARRGVLTISL